MLCCASFSSSSSSKGFDCSFLVSLKTVNLSNSSSTSFCALTILPTALLVLLHSSKENCEPLRVDGSKLSL